jgi:hypothetical protein
MPVVYKITYPNGKIYIGSDMTDNNSLLRQRQRRAHRPVPPSETRTAHNDILGIRSTNSVSPYVHAENDSFLVLVSGNVHDGRVSPKQPAQAARPE